MSLYAIVPVKNLDASKRRLATVFTPQERRQLTTAMLEDVLSALKTSIVDQILVVGEDSQVETVAKKFEALFLTANGDGLNQAIEEATAWCIGKGAKSVLILPADLPLVKTKDVNRLVALGTGNCCIVLSPSGNWGTNALYQNPPNAIPVCFGPNSFIEHIRGAFNRNISTRLHFSEGLSLDIDSAEDLKKMFELSNETNCRKVLEEIICNSKKAIDFFEKRNLSLARQKKERK